MATVVVTHSKISTKPTGTDPSIIYGSDWNGNHVVNGLENVPNVDTTNASNITSGTLPAGRMPALTGDVTTVAGTVATTIASNAVTNAKAAQMAAETIKGNNTSGLANAADLTGALVEQMLLFTQGGTGAVQQLLDTWVKGRPISVKDFGAVGDGIADDTAEIQATINEVVSSGGTLYLPTGKYKITTQLNVTAPIRIVGDGPYQSIIQPASGINGISIAINSAGSAGGKFQGPTFENFGIWYPTQATASTAAITATSSVFEVNQSTYRNLWINQAWDGFHFIKASFWIIDGCNIMDSAESGVFVENQNDADSGDNVITNTTIFNPFVTGTTVGIIWRSSGGMRIVNNKVNAMQNGIQIQLASGAATGDIIISHNSIESFGLSGVASAISVFRLGATGSLRSLQIQGNQIGSFANAVAVPVDVNGVWLTNLSILGNDVTANNTGTPNGFIVNSTSNFLIVNNVLLTSISAGTAILTGASADNAVIGPNIKIGTWTANSISSTNTTTIAPN